MKKMRYVAAPAAALAMAVSGIGAGVATAGPLDVVGQGVGSGMGVGGSIGGAIGMALGSAGDDIAQFKDVPGVLLKVIGGSVGMAAALTPGIQLPGFPIP